MDITDSQEAFLKRPNSCVIATVDEDGQPHATPVIYLYEGGIIEMIIYKGSKKHRNLMVNPRLSLSIENREPSLRVVMVSGSAQIDEYVSQELVQRLAGHYGVDDGGQSWDPNRIRHRSCTGLSAG